MAAPSGRRRTAGMWALAARMSVAPSTWIIITVLSVSTVALRAVERQLTGTAAVVYVASSIAVVPVVMLLAGSLVRRHLDRAAWVIGWAVGAWLVSGLLRIVVESALADFFGAPILVFPARVYVAQVLTLPVWAGLLGIVQAGNIRRAQEADERERLVVRLGMTTAERWQELDVERRVLADYVAKTIRPEVERIRALLAAVDPGATAQLREELRRVAEQSREIVRRASRETSDLAHRSRRFEGAPGDVTNVEAQWWRVAGLDTSNWSPAPMAAAAALLVTTIPPFLGVGEPRLWWLPLSVIALAVALDVVFIRALASVLRRVSRALGAALIVIANIGAVVVSYWLARISLSAVFDVVPGARFDVGVATILILSGLVVTVVQMWDLDRRDLIQQASRSAQLEYELVELDQDMEAEYERICLHTARLLHGPIQGRLAAIAMSLQLAAHGDGSLTPTTIRACRRLADACLSDLDAIAQLDRLPPPLEKVLRDLRDRWRGLLSLRWYLDPQVRAEVDADVSLRIKVEDFIGDCATNACRHGAARRMTISGRFIDNGVLEFAAEDDGSGPRLPVVVGGGLGNLGLEGIDWSIEASASGGTRVRYRPSIASSDMLIDQMA